MARPILKFLGTLVLGAVLAALAGFVLMVNSKPDLDLWHEVRLDQEFTADSEINSFADYLALEERLFSQLDGLVYSQAREQDARFANRYYRGSRSSPGRWPKNWNRSYELPVDSPAGGVLLLHGLTDSPYSLSTQGKQLHEAGSWVVGLRVPGHGTVPSALTHTRWQDMAGAVRLAMHHLREKVGDRPITIVGYSNGGALAVHYALSALSDDVLPLPRKLVLISPAIGVTPFAAFAKWQRRIGDWLGLEKLEWESLNLEYNPFKYRSFAVNAGEQSYNLTAEIARLLTELGDRGEMARFPPVLAFQSAVDATVSTPALITGLMDKLPENGSELVVFDVNRRAEIEYLLTDDPRDQLVPLINLGELPFALSVITNRNDTSAELVIRHYPPHEQAFVETALEIQWPSDVFSLSHVALPFPIDDPLYGRADNHERDHIQIGLAAYRGERGALVVSANDMLRLKWNPFHDWQNRYMQEFISRD